MDKTKLFNLSLNIVLTKNYMVATFTFFNDERH